MLSGCTQGGFTVILIMHFAGMIKELLRYEYFKCGTSVPWVWGQGNF